MPVGARPAQIATYRWHTKSDWWVKKNRYFMYMVREATAVFAALWVVIFLAQIPLMVGGVRNPGTYVAWLGFIHSPGWVIFSLVAFLFVMYHAVTFLNLMGTVITARVGKTRIGGPLIVGPLFLVWIGITIILAVIIMIPLFGG